MVKLTIVLLGFLITTRDTNCFINQMIRLKGMGKMTKERLLKELKTEIETKRKELNFLVSKDLKRDEVLEYSVELDKLIDKYYRVQLEKK